MVDALTSDGSLIDQPIIELRVPKMTSTKRKFRKLDAAWKATADTLPAVVWTATPEGSIEFVNQRWHELTGLPRHSVLEDAWRKITHPDDLAETAEVFSKALKSGAAFAIDSRTRCADGSYRWVRAQGAPMRDEAGAIVRWFGVTIDIDELKRTQQALERSKREIIDSELKFRVLAEAVPVIAWTADTQGWIDWYNHRWYEYTGQTPEEAAGWGWQAAHHPDDFPDVMERWPKSIATGEPFEMEFRLRGADGRFRWFLTRIHPLRDENGKIIRWYGSNTNIDEQKQALERSIRVAETLQHVFLPNRLPQRPDVRFDAVYVSAEKDALVGGDWYDAFELPDGRLALSMGDVVGHGLDASVVAGRVRQAIYTLAFEFDDPATVLNKANRVVCCQEAGTLVTALVGFIDAKLTRLRYASAGHPPPLIAYNGAEPAQALECGGLPLGVLPELDLRSCAVDILPHAVLALYTDGLIEFGRDLIGAEDTLKHAIARVVGDTKLAHPAHFVKLAVLGDHHTSDDAALLLIQFAAVEPTIEDQTTPLDKTWRFHSSDAYAAHISRAELMKYITSLAEEASDLFTTELILGEILANTVEHAPGLVEIHIDWHAEKPVVRVLDTGPGLRTLQAELPEDVLDEGGRGIFLIKALAEKVTVRQARGFGTELHAVLPLSRRSQDPAARCPADNDVARDLELQHGALGRARRP